MVEPREIKITPNIEIFENGFPICTNHSYFDSITLENEEEITLNQNFKNTRKVNCQTCEHYKQNECFFSQKQIDLFENQRKKNQLNCFYCSDNIDNLYSIIFSEYSKSHNQIDKSIKIKIPNICCSCYTGLKNQKLLETLQFKKKEYQHRIFEILGIFFVFTITIFRSINIKWLLWIEVISLGLIALYLLSVLFKTIQNLRRLNNGKKMAEQLLK